MDRRVFDNTVVLEVGTGSIAASFAGMILADNGARVVKVEPPGGDRLRDWNPTGFLVWNRGKESVCIDLATAEGQARLRSLAMNADVLIDGLRPGCLRQWGLEYEDLTAVNERLIYCAIRGFDEDGPYAHLRAYEGVLAAKLGFFNRGVFTYKDSPDYLNAPVINMSTGYLTLGSVSAALLARESLRQGQRLEVSMFTAANSYDHGVSASYQYRKLQHATDLNIPAQGGVNRYILFGCSADNRWFVFMNMRPYQAQALVKALGRDDMLTEPRFAKMPYFDKAEEAEQFELAVMETARGMDGEEIVKRLLSSPDVGFEELGTTQGAFDHPQVVHNRCAITVEDVNLGPIRQIGPIADFTRTPSAIAGSAPQLDDNHLDSDPLPLLGHTPIASGAGLAPLAGITILEVGHYYAMPYGLALAASLGARVIKVEGASADPWRMLEGGEPEVISTTCLNGKESIALNLQTQEGRDVLYRLVGKADAFVYSLRPDPATIGMGYDQMRAINPEIVYVQRPGYGSSGPYGGRPMYAYIGDAAAGMIMRNWGYWLQPELCEAASILELQAIQVARVNAGRMYADGHGANAVFAMTMMALLAKKRFGIGQHVESSMINAAIYGLADEFIEYDGRDTKPRQADAEQLGPNALYRLYEAADGWVFIAAPTETSWKALADALGRLDLLEDARLSSPDRRRQADTHLVAEIGRAIKTKDATSWEQELSAAGVGCAVANTLQLQEFTSFDQGLLESHLTFPVEHPTLGTLVRIGAPATFSTTPGVIKPGTVYGQNTETVLRELGYTGSEIGDLLTRGVAVSHPILSDR